eukprot:Pgem_evm1s6336
MNYYLPTDETLARMDDEHEDNDNTIGDFHDYKYDNTRDYSEIPTEYDPFIFFDHR